MATCCDVSDMTPLFNVTSGSDVTTLAARRRVDTSFLRMRFVINVLLPIVFGAGVAGNALNAVMLTRRRGGSSNDDVGGGRSGRPTAFERSAMAGLVALSASDFVFCLVGFAEVLFAGTPPVGGSWRAVARLYYDTYHVALMNLFLFSSTWLIALVSVERCLAVCCPFRAGALIRVRRTVAAHVVVFAVSILLNVPLFLRSTVHRSEVCRNGRISAADRVNASVTLLPSTTAAAAAAEDGPSCGVIYYARPSKLSVSRPGLLYVHKVVWFALGTFLPLLLIVYSNVRLVREICRMRSKSSAAAVTAAASSSRSASKSSLGVADRDKSATLTLTLTLIAIGVCFLLLVCPSMAIQFWRFASYSSYGGGDKKSPRPSTSTAGRSERIAIAVTNLTQAIKFSSNFLLYCVVNRSFRRTFGKLFRTRRCNAARRDDVDCADDERSMPAAVRNAALINPPLPAGIDAVADTGV